MTAWNSETSHLGLPMTTERCSRFVKETKWTARDQPRIPFVRPRWPISWKMEGIHCKRPEIGCLPTRNSENCWARSNWDHFLSAHLICLKAKIGARSSIRAGLCPPDGTMPHMHCCLLRVRRDMPNHSHGIATRRIELGSRIWQGVDSS